MLWQVLEVVFPGFFHFGKKLQKNANLVDLEKCCKMSIWLQKSALILPLIDEILGDPPKEVEKEKISVDDPPPLASCSVAPAKFRRWCPRDATRANALCSITHRKT